MASEKITLHVRGMTCDGCARHVTEALSAVPGVLHVEVPGWQAGQAIVEVEQPVPPETLIAAVKSVGYRAELPSPETHPAAPAFHLSGRQGDYDLLVIGGGSGGFAAAIRAAELGARVGMVNAGPLGGTCVNIGCVPSKALYRAAAAWYQAAHHPFQGVHTRAERLDWQAVKAQKDALVASLRQEKYADVLAAYPQISLIEGRARFVSPDAVEVNGQTLRAARFVIATGARPRRLPIPGVEEAQPLTSTSLMALDALPDSLIVLGGRAVALELGQTMARFGVRVTLLQRSERILPTYAPEVSLALQEALEAEGMRVVTAVKVQKLAREGAQRAVFARVNGEPRVFRAGQILMALGRQPNTEGLGAAQAGVRLDARGRIMVDETMRTTAKHIYATGDCTTRPQFVYVAAAGGSLAAENALTGSNHPLDLTVLPEVVFTDPQAARVGMTEAEAHAAGYRTQTSTLPLSAVPRALAAHDTRGLIQLVAEKENGRLLGAHILAAEGGEVVQTAAVALKAGFSVHHFQAMFFPYLTQVEGLKLAALAFDKDLSLLSCCAG